MNNKRKFFDIIAPDNKSNKTASMSSSAPTTTEYDDNLDDTTGDGFIREEEMSSSLSNRSEHNSYAYQPIDNQPQRPIDNADLAKEDKDKNKSPIARFFSVIFNYLLMPAAIVWFLLSFVFQPFYVSGKSMEPSLHDKDYLIISKVSLSMDKLLTKLGKDNNHPLQRGDIIVFHYPAGPSTFFIKRLIGLPGDRVVIKEGFITIYNKDYPSGLKLSEKYIDPQYKTGGDIDQVVPENNYFVVGDNRSSGGSFDSRNWGMLPKHYVVGSILIRLMPSIKIGSEAGY